MELVSVSGRCFPSVNASDTALKDHLSRVSSQDFADVGQKAIYSTPQLLAVSVAQQKEL